MDFKPGNTINTVPGELIRSFNFKIDKHDYVRAFAISNDEKLVYVSFNWNKEIRVFNVPYSKEETSMKGHVYGVYALVLNGSNKTLYSGSADNTIGVWTCKSRKKERVLEGHGGTVSALVLSKNEKFLFSLGGDNLLLIWSLRNYKTINSFNLFSSSNFSRAFALSDQYYTLFGRDKQNPRKLRILNLMSGETVKMVKVHTKSIRCVTVSPDDEFFYSGGTDGLIHVFKTKNADLVHAITCHKEPVNNLTVSKDNKFLATASNDKTVRLFNCQNNYEMVFIFKHAVEVSAISFSKTHQKLITGGWHFRAIKVWNTAFLGIDFDQAAIDVPGKFFMSKSPLNRGPKTEPSTEERMQGKVLEYAQDLTDMDDIKIARKSIENLGNVPVGRDSKDKLDAQVENLMRRNTGASIEELPEGDDLEDSKVIQTDSKWEENMELTEGGDKKEMDLEKNFSKP